MRAEEFLSLVLPDGEHYFVVEARDNTMNHHHQVDVAGVGRRAAWLERKPDVGNVYFALASFKSEEYFDDKGKKKRRTQENADRLKSFWIDMDCKGKGTDYPDQVSAVKDVLRLCAETGLPSPSVTVNSGYGVHAYWALTESISAREWMAIALRWRQTLDQHGIKHDSSCTTDCARILRPVGTFNRKEGEEPRQVRIIGSIKRPVTLSEFTSKLAGHGSSMPAAEFPSVDLSLNSLAIDAIEYRPSSIKEIVNECGLLHALGRAGGNVSEPLWHKTLGLVKHTIEGAKAIHLFSKGHPDYSAAATEAKAEAWSAGPTTCEVFKRESQLEMPEHCRACKNMGSITSPIQLGYPKVMMVEQARVLEATGFVEKVIEVESLPVGMDGRFRWENNKLSRNVYDKEASKEQGKDVYEWVVFCEFLFYPSSYYRDASDKHQMVWTLREREGVYKEFELSGGALGAGGQPLFRELGENGVTAVSGGKNNMEAYITEWGNELKKKAAGVETFIRFGWHGDRFLHGTTMYNPDGSQDVVRVGGDAANMAKYLAPVGELEKWKHLTDQAYNHDGMEPYQFILGLGFGSPLMEFMNVAGGTVVSAISYATGQGKTTAMRNAFGIYGCPDENTPVTLSRSSVTHKGIFAVAGILHNYPVLVDEMTNIEGGELSDIVYTWSQGQPRIRLVGNGELAPIGFGWSGVMLTSSNKPMTGIIAGAKPGADAELARLIEFDCSGVKKLKKENADVIFRELRDHHGLAGREILPWIVANQATVRKLLDDTQRRLDKKLGFTGQDRFWSAGYTVGIVGLMIAKKLGLVNFDVAKTLTWCEAQVRSMRGEIKESVASPEDCFGRMLTALSPGIIVTDIEGGRGSGGKEAYIIKEPRGAYTGRAVLDTGVAYITQPAVNEWCTKNQIDVKAMILAAVESGWVLSAMPEKRYPGKGTNYAMGQIRCYHLDWGRLENSTQTAPHLAQVVNLMNKGVA